MNNYWDIIRELREDHNLKQIEVAKIVGMSQQQYSKYENGDSEPSISIIIKLADYYSVSVDYLLGVKKSDRTVEALKKNISSNYTVSNLISDVLSLDENGRIAVIDYIKLQKCWKKYGNK